MTSFLKRIWKEKGQGEFHPAPVLSGNPSDKRSFIKRMLNVFADVGFGVSASKASMPQAQRIQRLLLLRLPLFASFFIHKVNAPKNHTRSQYNKKHFEWQGQILEEIAGKSSGEDIFAEVVNGFSGKVPGSLFDCSPHGQTLSFGGVNVKRGISELAGGNKVELKNADAGVRRCVLIGNLTDGGLFVNA